MLTTQRYDRCPYCGAGLFCPWSRCPYCHADFSGDTRYTCIGIRDEGEYEKRLADLDMLSSLVSAYEHRVHPIGPPTRWARIRFRWDQAWRWKVLPALVGGVIGALAVWVVMDNVQRSAG